MNKVTLTLGILGIVATFGLSSCYTLNLSASPSDQAISLSNKPTGQFVKHFTFSKTAHHLLYGLIPLNDIDLAKSVGDEIASAGGTSAVNLKIKYQLNFVDWFINAITLSIYNPLTLDVEGDVVK